MLRTASKRLLKRYLYYLSRDDPQAHKRPAAGYGMADLLASVSRLGFRPATVIDVGVAEGTSPLYQTFPDAFHLLIEPLDEFTIPIHAILGKYRGQHVPAAATSRDGEITLNIHTDHLAGSSSFREEMGSDFDGTPRRVQSVRIDTLTSQLALVPPFLLKVDVQGAELEVLDGAHHTLRDCELVLLEVSLFKFLRGSPLFGDVVHYMKDQCFVVYDLFGASRRPLDGALGQVDLAFVKEDGMFRLDHRYATPQQWQAQLSGRR